MDTNAPNHIYADLSKTNMWDNGVARLILEAYAEKLIEEMKNEPVIDTLSEDQARILKDRLKGLYSHLTNHPALMDRRLHVGSKQPPIPENRDWQMTKRGVVGGQAQPVCPSRTEWKMLYVAMDINDTEVEVFQPESGSSEGQQWFYRVSCNMPVIARMNPNCPGCCRGVNSERYNSECMTRKSYVMALVRRSGARRFDWNWIQVDSGCSCAIEDRRRG